MSVDKLVAFVVLATLASLVFGAWPRETEDDE